MSDSLAPIVLFVYNRPCHTLQVLESLMNNKLAEGSELYIYADGEKEAISNEEKNKIKETREVIRQKKWCGKVTIFENKKNKGLANSVIEGVTEIINKHKKIIVLEDDLILSKFFLEYMNKSLDLYEGIENVYSVNAFMFPIQIQENTTFLLPYTSSWGWGTWLNKWKFFKPKIDPENIKTIQMNISLKNRFNLSDYDYASMLNYTDNSWAIKWYFAVFSNHGLNVFPSISMVDNIGFDGSGTNSDNEKKEATSFDIKNKVIVKLDKGINLKYYGLYLSYFIRQKKSIKSKIISRFIKSNAK